jgi:hypothetical protein
MARINEFNRQILLDRAQPSNIDAAAAIAGGNKARQLTIDAQSYRQSGADVGALGEQITRQRDVEGQIKAQETYNDFARKKAGYLQEQRNARMTNPDGFAKNMGEWVKKQGEEYEQSIRAKADGQPFDETYFRQLMDKDHTSTVEQETDWENGMRVQNIFVGAERTIDSMNTNFALNNPKITDLPNHFNDVKNYVNRVGEKVFSPEQNAKFAAYGIDQGAKAVLDHELETDPEGLNYLLNYGRGGKEQVIDFVMNELEGGAVLVNEPDNAQARYGINSKANPDVNVATLDADTAKNIYRSKYWDKRLEGMPPAFQAVAFDAIVQHGNDKNTWAMIDNAQQNPMALVELRRQYYNQLATQNPEKYAQYTAGWENRLQKVTSYANKIGNGGAEFLDTLPLVSSDLVLNIQASIPSAIAAKQRRDMAAQEQKVGAFNTLYKEAYETVTKNLEPLGQEELVILKQTALNSGNPEAIQRAEAMDTLRGYVSSLRGMSDKQLSVAVREASADVNKNATPETRLRLELAEGVLAKQKDGVAKEGIAYWGRIGQARMPQPIDYQNPELAMNEIASREQTAATIQKNTGELLPIVTPDEIVGLQAMVAEAPPAQVASLLGYFDRLQPENADKLTDAIAKKDPVLAAAISIEEPEARRRLLAGAKIKDFAYDKAEFKTSVNDVVANMMPSAEYTEQAAPLVQAYYNSLATEKGARIDSSDYSLDDDLIRQSVEAIYGPMVDVSFGNTDKVFNFKDPATNEYVPEDDIYNMFNDIDNAALTAMFGELPKGVMGEDITAADIKENGRFVSTGDGRYGVIFDGIGALFNPKTGAMLEIDGRKLLATSKKTNNVKGLRQVENIRAANK